MAPDFGEPFQLSIDASDIGVGSVSVQEDGEGIGHPLNFYSKNLNKHQRKYSTCVEKETLALWLCGVCSFWPVPCRRVSSSQSSHLPVVQNEKTRN